MSKYNKKTSGNWMWGRCNDPENSNLGIGLQQCGFMRRIRKLAVNSTQTQWIPV